MPRPRKPRSSSRREVHPTVAPYRQKERGERLQKVLADAGVAARRECERLVLEGAVTVNGRTIDTLPAWVDPEEDRIEVYGKPLRKAEKHVYIMLFKPRGTVCTNSDPEGRTRAIDLVQHPSKPRLYCVGRLDLDASRKRDLLDRLDGDDLAYARTECGARQSLVGHTRHHADGNLTGARHLRGPGTATRRLEHRAGGDRNASRRITPFRREEPTSDARKPRRRQNRRDERTHIVRHEACEDVTATEDRASRDNAMARSGVDAHHAVRTVRIARDHRRCRRADVEQRTAAGARAGRLQPADHLLEPQGIEPARFVQRAHALDLGLEGDGLG